MSNDKKYAYYSDFGAKGDGVTDDFTALYDTHVYANEYGLEVKGSVNAVYYIGKSSFGKSIPVMTDVDFGGATFVIDDSDLPPHTKQASDIFRVCPTPECDVKRLPNECFESLSIKVGDENIGVKFDKKSLVTVYNNDRIFIRHGPNKASSQKREMLIVEPDGTVDPSTPVMWDYPEVTAIHVRSLDEKPLTLKNGTFVTIANRLWNFTDEEKAQGWCEGSQYYYYGRGIRIIRSNTTVREVTHFIRGEEERGGYPYAGWISSDNCANILYENCKFTGHKAYKTTFNNTYMGSYDFNLGNAVNITWRNCTQLNDITDKGYWGVMCSNFGRNLTYDHCVLSRFDAHEGSWNITVKDSVLGHEFNAVGGGEMLVENTKKLGESWQFLYLRNDYGSPWRGNITIRNCEHIGNKGSDKDHMNIIGGFYTNWDFGFNSVMPQHITIENFKADSARINIIAYDGITPECLEAGEGNLNVLSPTKQVDIINQEQPICLSKADNYLYDLAECGKLTVNGEYGR